MSNTINQANATAENTRQIPRLPFDPALSMLSGDEINGLLHAMAQVAHADGVTGDEKQLVKNFMIDLIPAASVDIVFNQKEIVFPNAVNYSEESRKIILFFAIVIGFSDSHFSPAEKIAVKAVAEWLAVSPEILDYSITLVSNMLLEMVADLDVETKTWLQQEMLDSAK